MDEPLLWVHLPESDKIAMWLVRYPQIADQVMDKLPNFSTIQSATLIFDLMAGRDAAQALRMAALESGFEYTADVFSVWYDHFSLALLHFWNRINEFNGSK